MAAEALLALLLAQVVPAALPDPLALSFAGWITEVEDDLGHRASRIASARTVGCVTAITGPDGSWTVDWRTVDTVALEDTFVFLRAPGLQIAVVADVQDAAGHAKLRGMWTAMRTLGARCRPSAPPRGVDEGGVTLP